MTPEMHRELSDERQRDIIRHVERVGNEGRRTARILLLWRNRHAA